MTPNPNFRNRMQLWHRPLAASLGGLLVAGCLTIPDEPRTLSADADGRVQVHYSDCGTREPATRKAARDVLGGDTIQLALWNAHRTAGPAWAADFARVSAGADLLLLQEARDGAELRRGLVSRHYRWTLNAAFQYQGADSGVLTAANASAESWCSLRATEPWLRIPKAALVTRYRLANGELLAVANLHGVNFSLGTGEFRGQLDALHAQLRHHTGAVILAGDFNTWSQERQRLAAGLAEDLQLKPVAYDEDMRSRFLGQPVDHVYYRGLHAEPAQVVTVSASDHHAVRVTFRIDTTRLAAVPTEFAAGLTPEPGL